MMQHKSSWITPALALAGAVVMSQESVRAQQPPVAAPDQPTCQEHHFALNVGKRGTEATARSCLNPDGSLDVVQRTPGLPVQSFHMSAAEVECGGAGQSACGGAAPQIDDKGCRSTSLAVLVGDVRRTATRRACPHADGSWEVTQTVPGLPVQSYVVAANVVSNEAQAQPNPGPSYTPAQAYYGYPCTPYTPCYPSYPYAWGYDPWFFGPPFFFGSVAIAFDNFHHSHHFDHFHDGNHAHFSHTTNGGHFAGNGGHFAGSGGQFSGGARQFSGSSGMRSGGATHFGAVGSGGGGHFSGGGGGGHFGGGGHR